MNVSSTTVLPVSHVNATDHSSASTSLAVGLTLFFLLLVIVLGVIAYKCRINTRKLQFGQRKSQRKEDYTEATPDAFQHYTSTHTDHLVAQAPIYENLRRTDRPAVNPSRSLGEGEEDLYLQCDIADDAIYSNDPECNLAILPDSHEEDVYITPDSL